MKIEKKIRSRIIKLLALSESPNESEAASALVKARMLLSRYGLDIADLSEERGEVIKEKTILRESNLAPWEEQLLKCILSVTFTEIIKIYEDQKEIVRIIGRKSNIITAEVLFDYLKEAIERRAAGFRDSIDDLESFRIGMVESIKQKFEERAKQEIRSCNSKDLVLTTTERSKRENMEYIRTGYGDPDISENWYNVDSNSYGLGKAIGKKISIEPQIVFEKNEKPY